MASLEMYLGDFFFVRVCVLFLCSCRRRRVFFCLFVWLFGLASVKESARVRAALSEVLDGDANPDRVG